MNKANDEADRDPNTLRISIDSKAKVNIGRYSRGGAIRAKEAPKANDHEMHVKKS